VEAFMISVMFGKEMKNVHWILYMYLLRFTWDTCGVQFINLVIIWFIMSAKSCMDHWHKPIQWRKRQESVVWVLMMRPLYITYTGWHSHI
jgi:hypothetical protein